MQKDFLYHGQAVGFEADIWEPGPHKIDGHAKCGLPGQDPSSQNAAQDPFEIPGIVSHGGCTSSVVAREEDAKGYFRTEVRATLNDLRIEGDVVTADKIELGMVSVYCRHWFNKGKPRATSRVRVIPYGCSIVNLRVKGELIKDYLPAPFHYSIDQCESYLTAATPDPDMEAEMRKAVIESPSRFLWVKNFGRIYFGEWTLLPTVDWHPIHQIYMVRMAMGSPQTGGAGGGGGQTDGTTGGGLGGG